MSKKTVMIVDDSASLRQVVKITLSAEGYDVIEACNGQEALALLGEDRIHLIISDVNMPVMDGITFVKELKKNSVHKFTPVIMLTTESGEKQMEASKHSGAKAWMIKPFKPEQMLQAIQKLILP